MDRLSPTALAPSCHPERSEGSPMSGTAETLRCPQDDVSQSAIDLSEQHREREGEIAWPQVWAFVIGLSAVSATAGLFLDNRGRGGGLFLSLLCFATLLIAAGFDSATGRIPNP